MRRRVAVAVIVGGLVVAACGAAPEGGTATSPPAPPAPTTMPAPSTETAADDLAAARARWADGGTDSYRYTFTNRCNECGPALSAPYEVNVHGGRTLPGAGPGRTVDALFAAIDDAIDDGLTTLVEYDPVTGVPTHIVIDPESFPVDGGVEWVVDDFTPGDPGSTLTNIEVENALAVWGGFGFEDYSFIEHIYCDCADVGTTPIRVAAGAVVESGQYSHRELFPITFAELLEGIVLFNDDAEELDTTSLAYLVRLEPTYGYVSWIWVEAVLDDGERIEFVMEFTDFEVVPGSGPTGEDPDQATAYEAGLAEWKRLGITDYRYTLSVGCFCPEEFRGPFVVVVEGGEITSVTRQGVAVDLAFGYTITAIYDLIGEHLGKGVRNHVTYDEQGIPMSVQLDLDAIAVDGGTSLEVTGFEPLGYESLVAELKQAETLWEQAGIDTYVVHYLYACECPGGNISVRVVDGVVESAEFSNASVSDEVLDGLIYPVHRMFSAIVDGIERGADSIDADFHPNLGYPTSIVIDYDRDTADEELVIVDIGVETG